MKTFYVYVALGAALLLPAFSHSMQLSQTKEELCALLHKADLKKLTGPHKKKHLRSLLQR